MKDMKIIGLEDVLEKAKKYAGTDVPILITGEPGVGKEVVAKFVHRESLRNGRIFNPINCGAANGLIDSELFGHKKGSFTDAKLDRPGRLMASAGGTVFLDEIGDMPLSVQAKILRFLNGGGEIQQIGCDRPVYVDTRIICATNQLLKKMITGREFRRDLYSRISGFEIHIPPLRERKEEIPLFVEYFFDYFAEKYQKNFYRQLNIDRLTEVALDMSWQGNVRELRDFIEKYVILEEIEEAVAGKKVTVEKVLPEGRPLIIPEREFSEKVKEKEVEEKEENLEVEPVVVDPADVGFENFKFSAGFLSEKMDCRLGSLFSNEDWKPFSLSIAGISDSDKTPFLNLSTEERKYSLKKALDKSGGHITKAGKSLGLSNSTSSRLVREFGLSEYVQELKKEVRG